MSQKGQLPAFFLLLLAVVLTIGVSVVSTSMRQVEQKSELSDSDRAFRAAEAGLEEALLLYSQDPANLGSIVCGPAGPACAPGFTEAGSAIKSISVAEPGVSGAYEVTNVEKDDVVQLELEGFTGTAIDLSWVNSNDGHADQKDRANQSAFILTEVYEDTSLGGSDPNRFKVNKEAVDCNEVRRLGGDSAGFDAVTYVGGANYVCQYRYSLFAATDPNFVPRALRMRNLIRETDLTSPAVGTRVDIEASGVGGSLPAQEVVITVVGGAGTSESTEEVRIKKPALPAVFDFGVYSGSLTDPLTHE